MTTAERSINFEIRRCTYDDIPAVMEINEHTLPENYPLFFYEQILDRYPEPFTLAFLPANGKIIGYIMWRLEKGPGSFGLDYVKKGHLVSLAVLNEYRCFGVASTLLSTSMSFVKDYGVAEYVLEVRVSNIAAVKLYEKKLGYSKIRIINHYYRDGEDAFYMCIQADHSNKSPPNPISMTNEEIIQHYLQKKQIYLLYRCPQCNTILFKSIKCAFSGSISPNDKSTVVCPTCNRSLSLFDISSGKYDIKDL